ncbi:MAG: S1/P1 nuclease [Bacteroidales bacterium]|nr:S1/P1 nuclease [Bacteroidales bacterium]
MKKIIVLISAASICLNLSAFDARSHAAIAYIAEQYLTPKAQSGVHDIFHGEHLYNYSSWPDMYRNTMLTEDGKSISHVAKVDSNLHLRKDLKADKNGYAAYSRSLENLKNHKNRPDSANIADLAIVVHLVGDMHCPSHISYPRNIHRTVQSVKYHGKDVRYHKFWDGYAMSQIYEGGFLEIAALADICNKHEIKHIQKGTMEDWVFESATECLSIYDLDPEKEVYKAFLIESTKLSKSQIRKAGYRLAKVLNDLFK